MSDDRNQMIWRQFGASIDMLENAIEACPEDVWGVTAGFQEFWYIAYHTLFWTDFYLQGRDEGFNPPEPFGLEELDPAGVFPPRTYSKRELLDYLGYCRAKLRAIMLEMNADEAARPITHGSRTMSLEEWLWYTMRHVQHHAAQLNLLLRQSGNDAPTWVSRTLAPLCKIETLPPSNG